MHQLVNQKHPKSDVNGFLERAHYWLGIDIDVGIFYAAIELRFTFERLLIRHGFASNNYSKEYERLHWQPKRLHKEIEREFKNKIDITKSYRFIVRTDSTVQLFGYFLSIPNELFETYGKLGDLLHAHWAIKINDPKKTWYKEKKKFLQGFADKMKSHSNPENSLDFINIPGVIPEECDSEKL